MNFLSRFFQPKETDSSRFERLEAKLRALADDNHDLDKRMKSIELDWEQTYDKVTHLMARITKRRKALEADEQRELLTSHDDRQEANAAPDVRSPLGMHQRLQEARKRFNGGR